MSKSIPHCKNKKLAPVQGENVTSLWEFTIYNNCTIQVNRSDIIIIIIIIKDFAKYKCYFIDRTHLIRLQAK